MVYLKVIWVLLWAMIGILWFKACDLIYISAIRASEERPEENLSVFRTWYGCKIWQPTYRRYARISVFTILRRW